MAESGNSGETIRFRDPSTGRFISSRDIGSGLAFAERFAPGGATLGRETVTGPPPIDQFGRNDGPHSTIMTRAAGADDNWLQFVEPPIERDVTEFRFVVEDSGYDSGFRTTAPFDAEESPADVAERLGITDKVVRVVYGISE